MNTCNFKDLLDRFDWWAAPVLDVVEPFFLNRRHYASILNQGRTSIMSVVNPQDDYWIAHDDSWTCLMNSKARCRYVCSVKTLSRAAWPRQRTCSGSLSRFSYVCSASSPSRTIMISFPGSNHFSIP